jgi:hypothetical protein
MGEHLYLYYSGWDRAYGRYSVMTTLLAEIVKDAIARGTTSVNLSTGNDVSKTRWRPREVVYKSRIQIAPRASARAHYLGYRAARSVWTGSVAADILPSFLARRPEPHRRMSRPSDTSVLRFHAVAAATAVFVALNLVDHHLDDKVSLLPRAMEHFLN